jgi:hypothetical protein
MGVERRRAETSAKIPLSARLQWARSGGPIKSPRPSRPVAAAAPETAPPADHLEVTSRARATRSLVVAPPVRPGGAAELIGRGNRGNGRKTANRRDLPRLWDFLIRARLASRWKTSAEPNSRPATSEPRFPGRRPGGKTESSVRPRPHPPEAAPAHPHDRRPGTGSHSPQPPLRWPPGRRVRARHPAPRAPAEGPAVTNWSARHEESFHHRTGG